MIVVKIIYERNKNLTWKIKKWKHHLFFHLTYKQKLLRHRQKLNTILAQSIHSTNRLNIDQTFFTLEKYPQRREHPPNNYRHSIWSNIDIPRSVYTLSYTWTFTLTHWLKSSTDSIHYITPKVKRTPRKAPSANYRLQFYWINYLSYWTNRTNGPLFTLGIICDENVPRFISTATYIARRSFNSSYTMTYHFEIAKILFDT